MKKTQENINKVAEYILKACGASTKHYPADTTWKQFHKCQAWISNCINNRYFLIRSYNTIVAVIDDQNGELYELGKWSVTTSKQVTQIFNLSDNEAYNTFDFQKLNKRYLVK